MYLIIDGNAVINHIFRTVTYELSKAPGRIFESDESGELILSGRAVDYFDDFITKYIRNIIYPFKNECESVYFVFDYPKYWRKMYIEWFFKKEEHSHMEAFEYKQRPDTVDQHKKKKEIEPFFRYTREVLVPQLESVPGVYSIKMKSAEGDDVITVLSDILCGDIVIWSVDTDLAQHVGRFADKSVIMVTPNQHKRPRAVYLSESMANNNESFTDLMNIDVTGSRGIMGKVEYLTSYKQYDKRIIDPAANIFIKVLSGDKGSDNIPSTYTWKAGSRTMTLTEKVATAICERLRDTYSSEDILSKIESKDDGFMELLLSYIVDAHKNLSSADEDKLRDVKNNIYLNYKIIRLKRGCIPNSLYDRIEEAVKSKDNTGRFDMSEYENIMFDPLKNIKRK